MKQRPDDYSSTNPLAMEGVVHTLRVDRTEPPDAREQKRLDAWHEMLDRRLDCIRNLTPETARDYADAADRHSAAEAACRPAHRGEGAANDDGEIGQCR